MTRVSRVALVIVLTLIAGTACATKVPPPPAGQPHPQPLGINEVPGHVDNVMRALRVELLLPVRESLRAAPVSTSGVASDGSYTRWLTEVSEALVSGKPMSKDLPRISERAAHDLARIAGRSYDKKTDPPLPDLDLMARQLNVHFQGQSYEVRKTAAAYLESIFSIAG
jgi:hypothetical protein